MMRRALELATRGEGRVEPNPMVGCVIVRDNAIIAEGWHEQFGERHAEVAALANATEEVAGATAYVTLEPCCHHGKTPPCSDALIAANIGRVVIGSRDPFAAVNGGGIQQLEHAGIEVDVGVCESAARDLVAPYLTRMTQDRPWLICKWAMTLDGKLATSTGDSQWISNEASRAIVHTLRGRVDAVMVGSGTARIDDPLLTARPMGARVATRIVIDSQASLALDSQLVRTASTTPVLIAVAEEAADARVVALAAAGCEVVRCTGRTAEKRMDSLLKELANRGMTNVLVEGGARLFGLLLDAGWIDEVHAFIAPKIAGGGDSISAISGRGVQKMCEAFQVMNPTFEQLNGDIYCRGRIMR